MRAGEHSYLCGACFSPLMSLTENSLSNGVVCARLIFSLRVPSSALVLLLLLPLHEHLPPHPLFLRGCISHPTGSAHDHLPPSPLAHADAGVLLRSFFVL